MAITNKRSYIDGVTPQNEKELIAESLKRNILKEAEEDELVDDVENDLEDAELNIDLDAELDEPLEGEGDATEDISLEGELTDPQHDQVDDWVREILNTTISEDDPNELLPIETEGDDILDASTELNIDLPIDGEEMNDIISSDEPLVTLETSLENAALKDDELDTVEETIDEGFELDLDDDDEDAELMNYDELSDDQLSPEDRREFGMEETFLESDNKSDEELLQEACNELENQYKNKVKDAKENVDITTTDFRAKEVLKTTDKKFKEINKDNLDTASKMGGEISKLKLENYRLNKLTQLLVVTGDMMNEASRVALVEGFEKCKTKENIDKAYNGYVTKIKEIRESKDLKKKSLNESKGTTKVVLKENTEKLDPVKERRLHLMGFKTVNDMYNMK